LNEFLGTLLHEMYFEKDPLGTVVMVGERFETFPLIIMGCS